MTYQKITIPLDHGNRNMKTAEEVFTSGLAESDLKPVLGEYLQYNGKFYSLTGERIPYMRDKSLDDRFFILPLFGIGKELERRTQPQKDIIYQVELPVGLPPKHYGALFEKFGHQWIHFRLSGASGGQTGSVSMLYNRIISRVSSDFDMLLEDTDIDTIILGKNSDYSDSVIRLVKQMTKQYVDDFLGALRERGIDLKTGCIVFISGGAKLLREYLENTDKIGNIQDCVHEL